MCVWYHQGTKYATEMALWSISNLIRAEETVGSLTWVYIFVEIEVEGRVSSKTGWGRE